MLHWSGKRATSASTGMGIHRPGSPASPRLCLRGFPKSPVHSIRKAGRSGRHGPDLVVGRLRIKWSLQTGSGGRITPEYASETRKRVYVKPEMLENRRLLRRDLATRNPRNRR